MQQKVVEKPAKRSKATKPESVDLPADGKTTAISAAKFSVLTVPIKNADSSPLVLHRFSEKARQQMKEAQELGSVAKKRSRAKEPKDFDAAYNGARYISHQGWDGFNAASIRNAMISTCRLVGFKMTIAKMALFAEADGTDKHDGTPLIRIYGKPVKFEQVVKNQTGVADIRVRPRWDEWSATLRIRFDRDWFTDEDVVNLLVRAGAQNGLGEGRPASSGGNGLGWGLFEIDTSKPIQLTDIAAPKIEFVRSR